MEWINELLWGEGVGHSILLLSVVIALGIQLGKLKLFGISLYENSPAESPEVQAIVHEWQQYISEHFYECNKQILSNLGVLYICLLYTSRCV